MSRKGVVKAWMDLGLHDPPPRVHRNGHGISYDGVCPVCHATSWKKVKESHWSNQAVPWQWYQPVQYHCDHCQVRWYQPDHPHSCYWFRDTESASNILKFVDELAFRNVPKAEDGTISVRKPARYLDTVA